MNFKNTDEEIEVKTLAQKVYRSLGCVGQDNVYKFLMPSFIDGTIECAGIPEEKRNLVKQCVLESWEILREERR